MHYLCLHGAIGNIEVCGKLSGCSINADSCISRRISVSSWVRSTEFEFSYPVDSINGLVSAPLQKELDSDNIKFNYINGPVQITPPPGN